VTDRLNKIPAEDFVTPWISWKHALTCVLYLMDPILNKKTEKIHALFFFKFCFLSAGKFGPHCVLDSSGCCPAAGR
jgi:hypothetical protein